MACLGQLETRSRRELEKCNFGAHISKLIMLKETRKVSGRSVESTK